MDDEENRAFLNELRQKKQTIVPVEDSSDDSSDAVTQPPTPRQEPPPSPSPPPPRRRPGTPDSSAPTVSPPRSPPPSPPVPLRYQSTQFREQLSSSPVNPLSRLPGKSRAPGRNRHRTPSPASTTSTASTVPPPSPGALNRVTNRTTPRAVTISIDAAGIEDLKDDDASSVPHFEYPKLLESRFAPEESSVGDLLLSNRGAKAPLGVLPARIRSFLSPFQRDGVTFMYRLYERDRGGLLADSMGLGKTVQTICFLGAAFAIWDRAPHEDIPAPKILVVAPISVRENWQREFETWTPFRIMLYNRETEPEIARKLREGKIDVLISGDNPVASRCNEFFSKPVGNDHKWKWDVVIVDEIHIAKNRNTKIFKSLKALPKTVMFGLTGTAVQNRLNELWNVMNLVVPSTLWPSYKSFRADYTDVINKGTKKDASEYMRRKARERIEKLRKLLGKHLVRRPKSVIEAQLPGKTDYCVLMRMKRDGLQGYMYQRFQNSYDVKMLRDALLPCDCGSDVISKECCHRYPATEENLSNAPIWAMTHKNGACEKCPNCICLYLQHFSRWLAAHALLALPGSEETDQEKILARKQVFMYYLGDRTSVANEPLYSLERDKVLSCKLNVALKLLKTYESNGNKTIIFYESLRLGEILRRWAERNRLSYEVIDGSVTKGRRQGAVDRFNTEKNISTFFISKKAGATGLNIYGADRVLIFEPCWNPTLDLQAGDRAYRLGQKRVVHIIRLVVENTIEHYVFKTALSKSQISNAILDNTKEEWRVREDEVGSMRAMLSMGDVFEGDNDEPDDFKVVEAEQLDDGKETNDSRCRGDSRPDNAREESDSLREDYALEVDVLGEEGVCSLDVDLNEDSVAEPLREDEKAETGNEKYVLAESQLETDQLFGEGGASKKIVMHSTSARKRKRQIMGVNDMKGLSGINAHGAGNVNFDEADYVDLSVSTGSNEEGREDSWDEPVVRRRRRGTANSSLHGTKKREEPVTSRLAKRKRSGQQATERTENAVVKQRESIRHQPLEELSDPSWDGSVMQKPPHHGESLPRKSEAQKQNVPNSTRPNRDRRKETKSTKKTASKGSIAKDPKQKKQAPVSAFAARARVRR